MKQLFIYVPTLLIMSALLCFCGDDGDSVSEPGEFQNADSVADKNQLQEDNGGASVIGYGEFYKNYIQDYFVPDAINSIVALPVLDKLHFELYVSGDWDTRTPEISKQIGDTCYNHHLSRFTNTALSDTLSAIEITCDLDYDADHKAGASLTDIAKFYYYSALSFVQSGYKEADSNSDDEMIKGSAFSMVPNHTLYAVPLSELEIQKPIYIRQSSFVVLDHLPENHGWYVFTIKLHFEDKTILSKCEFKY